LLKDDFMKNESPILQPVFSTGGCAGHILRTAKGFRACDFNDKQIGVFETADRAAAAVLARAATADTV
jgi:hypothetical protein